MKFLCLAYGAEGDWLQLSAAERDALLAQDDVLRRRGDLVVAVEDGAATLRAWDGTPEVVPGAFARSDVPLAGFSVIEAESLDEVVRLVSGTPCARARGAIEIRPILVLNAWHTGGIEPRS